MVPTYRSSRPCASVTGTRKSGLTWSQINGPINPRHKAICKLCWAGAGMASLFMWAGIILAITP